MPTYRMPGFDDLSDRYVAAAQSADADSDTALEWFTSTSAGAFGADPPHDAESAMERCDQEPAPAPTTKTTPPLRTD